MRIASVDARPDPGYLVLICTHIIHNNLKLSFKKCNSLSSVTDDENLFELNCSGLGQTFNMAEWNITASAVAQNTSNPIRKIVDRMTVAPNPDKEPVRLSIGAIP